VPAAATEPPWRETETSLSLRPGSTETKTELVGSNVSVGASDPRANRRDETQHGKGRSGAVCSSVVRGSFGIAISIGENCGWGQCLGPMGVGATVGVGVTSSSISQASACWLLASKMDKVAGAATLNGLKL